MVDGEAGDRRVGGDRLAGVDREADGAVAVADLAERARGLRQPLEVEEQRAVAVIRAGATRRVLDDEGCGALAARRLLGIRDADRVAVGDLHRDAGARGGHAHRAQRERSAVDVDLAGDADDLDGAGRIRLFAVLGGCAALGKLGRLRSHLERERCGRDIGMATEADAHGVLAAGRRGVERVEGDLVTIRHDRELVARVVDDELEAVVVFFASPVDHVEQVIGDLGRRRAVGDRGRAHDRQRNLGNDRDRHDEHRVVVLPGESGGHSAVVDPGAARPGRIGDRGAALDLTGRVGALARRLHLVGVNLQRLARGQGDEVGEVEAAARALVDLLRRGAALQREDDLILARDAQEPEGRDLNPEHVRARELERNYDALVGQCARDLPALRREALLLVPQAEREVADAARVPGDLARDDVDAARERRAVFDRQVGVGHARVVGNGLAHDLHDDEADAAVAGRVGDRVEERTGAENLARGQRDNAILGQADEGGELVVLRRAGRGVGNNVGDLELLARGVDVVGGGLH